MSKAGMHNYCGRGTGDAVVRGLAMGRDLDLFLEDVGRTPITPNEAYELGLDGGLPQWRRQGGGQTIGMGMPPIGLECLPEYARGTAEGLNREEDWLSRHDFMDTWDDRCYGPRDSIFWAFYEVETGRWRQIEDAWGLHDTGFVPESEFPVFVRRATPMEDLLDMEHRIRMASAATDYRAIEWLGRALSCQA